MYQELKQKSDITLQFNCDRAPVFNSSKFNICGINELPTGLLNCHMMLYTEWFGRVKPYTTTFLQRFLSEITNLHRVP